MYEDVLPKELRGKVTAKAKKNVNSDDLLNELDGL